MTARQLGTGDPECRTVAEDYLERGWAPVPVHPRQKRPVGSRWQHQRLTKDDLPRAFPPGRNIGVLTGEPSGGLVDIDLDSLEACRLADHFLPSTDAVFGRESRPASHHLYSCPVNGLPRTVKFRDPTRQAEDERSMIVELRSTGGQTVMPPSIHPSGETVAWRVDGEPCETTYSDLMERVSKLAAAALLARHWPAIGARHDASLALTGGLLRAGWSHVDVTNFIDQVVLVAGDEERADRLAAARSTRARLDSGENVTGWPTLAELTDERVVAAVRKWLGIRGEAKTKASAGEAEPAKVSQATRLVELARGADLFHDSAADTFASIRIDGCRRAYRLEERAFRRWLARAYYVAEGRAPTAAALADALNVLEGRAAYEGPQLEVHVRLAEWEGDLYLDVGDDSCEAVRVSPRGWSIVRDPPVRFLRPRGLQELPVPEQGGSVEMLRPFVNVSGQAWPLVLAWLLAALRPVGPYPVLVLFGEQGSAKTTVSRMLRRLVDPNRAPVRATPRDGRDLIIAATNSHIVAFDNVSRIRPWLSDALCRLSTGGGYAVRALYTDREEVLFEAQRPCILNGIGELAERADLLDRALLVECPTIAEHSRRTEADIWAEFDEAQPKILGGLLDALSGALLELPRTHLTTTPRMADFARLGVAGEEALGLVRGEFLAAYQGNRDSVHESALESSSVGMAVRDLVESEDGWEGTASDLLTLLDARLGHDDGKRRPTGWPTTPRGLSADLDRAAPNLRHVGVVVERPRRSNHGRVIQLRRGATEPARPSQHAHHCVSSESDAETRGDGPMDVATYAASANGRTVTHAIAAPTEVAS